MGGSFWLTRLWWFNDEWITSFNEENWDALTVPAFIGASLFILTIIFVWICALGLKKIRNSISTEDSLDVFFKRA